MASHGSFQLVLIVATDTNEMNETAKKEIYELFKDFKTFASVRYYNNCLYMTYADAKYGYEAYAQLNNYYLASHGLSLIVKVENEQSYQKLIEQELMDCFLSLNYLNENFQKLSFEKKPSANNIEVGDLLGSSFHASDDPEDSTKTPTDSGLIPFLNLPANLRPNVSIFGDMKHLNMNDATYSDRHQHHNPLVKALSNSNLHMFDQPMHSSQHNSSQHNWVMQK